MSVRHFVSVLVGLICAAFLLGQVTLVKPTVAQAKSSKPTLTHQTSSAQARPDLAVDRVWTGTDCKVRVRLRNAGQGRISPKVSRFDALMVKAGSRTVGKYTFKQVDPRNKLLKPGGVVVFIVPMEVSAKVRVEAVADPGKKIKEADESRKSNSASAVLVPCRVATHDLPIRVSRVYVKQGTLRLVLSRPRTLKLDVKIFRTLKLKVRGAGGHGAWAVPQFDKKGSLRKLGKVEFDTELKLRQGARAHTRLLWKGGSRMASFRVPADLSRTVAAGGMRAQQQSRRETIAPGPASMTARTRTEQGRNQVGPSSAGIKVLSPKEGDEITRGGRIRVEYRFTQSQNAGEVRFALIPVSGGGSIAQAKTYYRPATKKGERRDSRISGGNAVFNWRLPSGLNLVQGEEYVVMVFKKGVRGTSGSFKFIAIGDRAIPDECHGCVFITSPKPGDVWPRGTTQRISWYTTPRDGRAPSGWRVYLLKHRASDPITPSRIQFNSSTREYYFDWRVPGNYPTGSNFRPKVVATTNPWASRELSATGGNFTIPENSLAFIRDFAEPGRTYYHTNQAHVQWRIDGHLNSRVIIYLMRGDRIISTIAPEVRAGTGRFRWAVGQGTATAPPGDDYYLRIRTLDLHDPPLRADSAKFTIAQPAITVMLPHDGLTYRHGETLLVRWAAPYLQGNVKIYLKGGGYTSNLPLLGTAPASSAMFMWRVGRLHPDARGEVLVEGDDMKVVIIADNNGPMAQSEGHFSIVVAPPLTGLRGDN